MRFKIFKISFATLLFFAILVPSPGAEILFTNNIKTDHFGYRPGDLKIAYFTVDPGGVAEVRRSADNSLAYSVDLPSIQDKGMDKSFPLISGDHVWWVDFSSLREAGSFYISSPNLLQRSYDFRIAEDIYRLPMLATLKALYLQRCGTAKPAIYAGNWSDNQACHLRDMSTTPGCGGSPYGVLDLSGGWHDAGDYNKFIEFNDESCGAGANGNGGQTLWYLLSAYELNPGAFYDGQGNIPESGNGVPDILDEAKWELDWYLKMQMRDHHVLSEVDQPDFSSSAPPSTDRAVRLYYPPGINSEAIFVACVAHGARVLAAFPAYADYAATLRTAAMATWNDWVANAPASGFKFWAAAEIFHLDSSQLAARNFVEGFQPWSRYGLLFNDQVNYGIYTYIQTPGASEGIVAAMKTAIARHVNWVFQNNDLYNSGIVADDYYWSSNQVKAEYAMDLFWAARFGATGSHTPAECLNHAQDYLHYLNGANPMNMVYMSNAESAGAKHGIWHLYHAWFGSYDDSFSRPNFIGKPAGVNDPLYPYFSGIDNFGITDTSLSASGPAPGFIVDGPTYQYYELGGRARPPNLPDGNAAPYGKAYRDWNYSDPTGARTMPWIVNETGIYYITSYTFLASQFVSPAANRPRRRP
ncbi:MAG TPA: glycoside hydrolase family 9 protein [Acidobacteriota bacterium]